MNKIVIKIKNKDTILLAICYDNSSNRYKFINLCNWNISKCSFNSIEKAKRNLQKYINKELVINNEEIIEIKEIKETSKVII